MYMVLIKQKSSLTFYHFPGTISFGGVVCQSLVTGGSGINFRHCRGLGSERRGIKVRPRSKGRQLQIRKVRVSHRRPPPSFPGSNKHTGLLAGLGQCRGPRSNNKVGREHLAPGEERQASVMSGAGAMGCRAGPWPRMAQSSSTWAPSSPTWAAPDNMFF